VFAGLNIIHHPARCHHKTGTAGLDMGKMQIRGKADARQMKKPSEWIAGQVVKSINGKRSAFLNDCRQ
jgi:hypothetical protein